MPGRTGTSSATLHPMFETIGKPRKVNRRRQAGALAFALLLMLSLGSALLVTGSQFVEEVLSDDPIEVTFFDDLAPPPPPPPPPPPASTQNQEEEEDEEEEEEEEDDDDALMAQE